MDCQEFEACIVRGEIEDSTADRLQRHWKSCRRCRERYDFPSSAIFPAPAKMKSEPPTDKMTQGNSSGLFQPVEFKGEPVTFTLLLDNREEEIKIVEPEFDFPIPEDGRLIVREDTSCIIDVKFLFNLKSDRPYELHFRVRNGVEDPQGVPKGFGKGISLEKELNSVYREEILRKPSLSAWIEMTRGKARVYIRYREPGT